MFLVAGTFLSTFRTRLVARLGGAIHTLPIAGALWVAGFVALSGTPPFALFLSELGVLRAGLEVNPWIGAAFLASLATAFVGMARVVLTVALGPPVLVPPVRESWGKSLPPLALLALALLLGMSVPAWLAEGLRQAAALVGVS
jgi:hydrogenase-4 component F